MTENFSTFSCHENNQFKEPVCIDTYRVYDSCADKDCFENLRVNFSESGQHIIDQASSVRVKNTNVITTFISMEPVPFRRGYYSIDMTYFFEINLEAFVSPSVMPATVSGLCISNKKVVLYGSEGSVKTFTSEYISGENDIQNSSVKNLPRAIVQVAEPIALSAKLCNLCDCQTQSYSQHKIPECIYRRFGGEFVRPNSSSNIVLITLGVFTIVQLERNVQVLVPACNYCVPTKECIVSTEDNPCDVFNSIEFPTDEFFPPQLQQNTTAVQ